MRQPKGWATLDALPAPPRFAPSSHVDRRRPLLLVLAVLRICCEPVVTVRGSTVAGEGQGPLMPEIAPPPPLALPPPPPPPAVAQGTPLCAGPPPLAKALPGEAGGCKAVCSCCPRFWLPDRRA